MSNNAVKNLLDTFVVAVYLRNWNRNIEVDIDGKSRPFKSFETRLDFVLPRHDEVDSWDVLYRFYLPGNSGYSKYAEKILKSEINFISGFASL